MRWPNVDPADVAALYDGDQWRDVIEAAVGIFNWSTYPSVKTPVLVARLAGPPGQDPIVTAYTLRGLPPLRFSSLLVTP